MNTIFAFVFTGILIICAIISATMDQSNLIPVNMTAPTIIAIGVLWLVALVRGLPKLPRTLLLIAFCCMFLFISSIAVVIPMAARFDQPKSKQPVYIGQNNALGAIAIVYHPGGSAAVENAVNRLGEGMAAKGYAVTVFTASSELKLDLDSYKAIVCGSPIYGGQVRPPLKQFLVANAPIGVPVFALFSAGSMDNKEGDLARFSEVVSQAGGKLHGGAKVSSSANEQMNDTELALLGESIVQLVGK